MGKELDAREKRFVEEYLIDLDPKRAAIEAGYSATMAASKAYQWVSNGKVKPHVYAAVHEAQAKRSERTEITQDMVLQELALLGFANAGEYFKWGPNGVTLKDSDELTREQQAAVSEVSETITEKGGTIRMKMHDKKGALVDIGRHLGMFTDKHEFTGKDGGPIQYENMDQDERTQRIEDLIARRGIGADPATRH